MMFNKLSIGLWSLDASGYWDNTGEGTIDKLRAALKIQGLKGVELIYPTHVNEDNFKEVKEFCTENSLEVVSVNPNVWSDKDFQKGAFTSNSPAVRRKAIEYGKRAYDIGKELGAKQMCLWPGQDGYDYPFQEDLEELWDREAKGIKEVASYAKGHKIGIEFKARDPRGSILLDSTSTVLMFSEWLSADNIGIYLDFGHSLLAKENVGSSIVKAMKKDKLYGIHINDNYGATDEDMVFMSVHYGEALEFVYYLKKFEYSGWISLDIAPRKEDPIEACNLCFNNLRLMEKVVERIDKEALKIAQKSADALKAQYILSKALIN